MSDTMTRQNRAGQASALTPGRRALLSMLDLTARPHAMYGLLEVDVTHARRVMAEQKARTGEALSFTGFLAFCMARAIDENKARARRS